MAKSRLAFVLMLMTTAGLVHADVGDLKPVAIESGQALMARPLFASRGQFAKPTEGDGTVSKHAAVATFQNGPIVIKAAIDSRQPDAKTPDVVRFDFTGEGKFDDKLVVPLKIPPGRRGSSMQASFGPVTFEIQRDGTTIPLTVNGVYFKSGSYRHLNLSLGMGLKGMCKFGGKTYTVCVIDGNSNLRLGDATTKMERGGKVFGVNAGDTLIVDVTEEGAKKSLTKSFYGQPVLVDGTWYGVTISPDQSKIVAEPLDIKTGMIRIKHQQWFATLIGEKHILHLSGDAAPIAIPSDRYIVTNYHETVVPDKGGLATLQRSGQRELFAGSAKAVEVVPGETTELAIGSPLTAGVTASQKGRTVTLSLKLTDASGASIDSLSGPKGRPPKPVVEILDVEGKTVHKATMEYG